MENNSGQDKTEQPTAHKLKKAREEGNVAKSTEVSSVMLLIASVMVFANFGDFIYKRFWMMFEQFFMNVTQPVENIEEAREFLIMAVWHGFQILAPLLGTLLFVALLVNVAQTKGMFSSKLIAVKGKRLNPLKGVKKIVSSRGLVELVKGFSKIFVVGVVIYQTIKNEIVNITAFMVLPLSDVILQSGYYIGIVVYRILVALFILSILDAAYGRWKHRKDLMMTKQEVKDEFKQMDGDPHMKNRRKQFASSLIHRPRMDHAVLASDVVVTNPTHYSVAIHYDPQHNDAPIVRVKGMRNRALKIREFANHYDIPIIENPPVARALYATTEEGQYVPSDLYQAVAEILAYVYQMKDKKVA